MCLTPPSQVWHTLILGNQIDSQETGHDPVVVDLVDVKVGHDYEPVITTFSGKFLLKISLVLRP